MSDIVDWIGQSRWAPEKPDSYAGLEKPAIDLAMPRTALPPVPRATGKDYSMSPWRIEDMIKDNQARKMQAEVFNEYDKRMRAVARAKDFQISRMVENAAKVADRQRGKRQSATKRYEKRVVKNTARGMGLGPDLYK